MQIRDPYADLFEQEHVSVEKDLSNVRVIELNNGNKINIKRNDPYGFWTVHYEKGQIPKALMGNFTSYELARKQVMSHLGHNRKRSEVVTEKD